MYLLHVTLDTGDKYRSERAQVSDDAIRAAGQLLRRALYPRRMPSGISNMLAERGAAAELEALHVALSALHPAYLPGLPLRNWILTAGTEGRSAMMATVMRPAPAGGAPAPVLTFGVARDSRSGAGLWRRLHEPIVGRGLVVTDPERPPSAPWVGTRMEIGAALPMEHPAVLLPLLADCERCIAWAWLDEN